MRFYGLCLCLLAVMLVILPILPEGIKEETIVEQEPIIAVVEPLEIMKEPLTEEDKPVIAPLKTEQIINLNIQNASTGQVDQIPLEDFTLGALCSEMPATFHLEALKAQAVSARTWAVYQQLWQREHPDETLDGADFQSDPLNWKGYVTESQAKERFGEKFEEYWSVLTQAVQETEGQILCMEGEPIAAAYHAISGGKTEAAQYVWGSDISYLQAVDSRGDELAPGYEEILNFSDNDMKIIFSAAKFEGDPSAWFEILQRSPSGYVTEIQVGDLVLSGRDFRSALDLRSSHFTIAYGDGGFVITTKGYGHGAGLSQYGADFMARQGSTYEEILSHYYSGAELCSW